MLTQSELDYRQWLEEPDFPNLTPQQAAVAKQFVERIKGHDWEKPLYPHQYAAITKIIYAGEKLGKWESLLDIVTGGGKTVIMAGLIAYFWQVRGNEKFLILVPNTIVRERVKEDFEVRNPAYAYREFPFFFNSHQRTPERLVCNVLRDSGGAAGIRDAHVIVSNIHQLYENRQSPSLEVLLSDAVHDLVILNDEAHNAAAEQYREVLKLLGRSKTKARVDLTATPFRLDKQDLDTYPPIYEYHVQQAMKDGVVKQVVVTKPDIASVKLQYEEWDENDQVIKTLDAEEVPWEQIEQELRRGGAVRFVTAKNARKQQLQIAQSCLDYQRKCVPLNEKAERAWEPLLLVVALSQKDAWQMYETLQNAPFNYKREQLLLVHSKQDEVENKKAFLLGRRSPEGLNAEDATLWQQTRQVRVIIAVSMLREGWDVRNIAVICLFRKFSFQKKGERIYTVYGPQIIGRGLRRIRPPSERDHLFAIDHPAFNHGWLWQLLAAHEYAKPLNPGDAVDEDTMEDLPFEPPSPIEPEGDEDKEDKPELDIEDIISDLPTASGIRPIADWQKHFRELQFDKRVASALQKITNIKSQRLGSDTTAHELPDDAINLPELNQSVVETVTAMTREALAAELRAELINEPHYALIACFKMETADQTLKLMAALEWIMSDVFKIDGLAGLDNAELRNLRKLCFCLPQITEEFRRPEIVIGILGEEA
jgi:superfamily II DNA or RNA helicase